VCSAPPATPAAPSPLLQEEEAAALVECLLEADALSLLVHRLSGFDEKVAEEAVAVNGVLSIVENMIEVKPEVAELAVEQTKVRRGWWRG
jgi:beta-catenin-like protein 1